MEREKVPETFSETMKEDCENIVPIQDLPKPEKELETGSIMLLDKALSKKLGKIEKHDRDHVLL